MLKRCSKCGIEKELNEFYKGDCYHGRHRPVCKKCMNLQAHSYHARHKKEIAERDRMYRILHKKEIFKRRLKYRTTHREQIAKSKRIFYFEHKQGIAEQKRRYNSTLSGRAMQKRARHKRRMREKTTEVTLTAKQWTEIVNLQSNCCNMCGKRFTIKRFPTVDHIIPISAGGGLTFENVQALCLSCNSGKRAKLDLQFIQTWAHERK